MKGITINKPKKVILLAVFGALYIASYGYARSAKFLVHRVSYATIEHEKKQYFHKVVGGDFGVPMLTGATVWRIAGILYILHSPLRFAEVCLWQVYPRKYEFNKKRP
jgi:hypothetical protein